MRFIFLFLLLSGCASWKSTDDLMRDSYFEGCMDTAYIKWMDAKTMCAGMADRFDPYSIPGYGPQEKSNRERVK